MKRSEISFDLLPGSAVSETSLNVCLKCIFDFFLKQLGLALRTAYIELKTHVPEETDFTGASTSRPHFFAGEGLTHCPYCNGTKRWFATFHAYRIDADITFEKERKKLWAALKKQADRYTLWQLDRTQMQIFSEWLDRLKHTIDFDADDWLLRVAVAYIKRARPSSHWDEILQSGVSRVQLDRQAESDWRYENSWLYLAPALYGDALMIQHLLSRSQQHGGHTFEGRLTLQELMRRLRQIGYLHARGIELGELFEAFEQAIAKLVASGSTAVYYAVDRSEYLEKLKSVYEKKRDK